MDCEKGIRDKYLLLTNFFPSLSLALFLTHFVKMEVAASLVPSEPSLFITSLPLADSQLVVQLQKLLFSSTQRQIDILGRGWLGTNQK